MGDSTQSVAVVAFGSAVAVLGWTSRTLAIEPGMTVQSLIDRLENECPRFVEGRGRVRYAVNEQYAAPDTALHPGDEVAIIPPVSGGALERAVSAACSAWLTRAPLDLAGLQREASDPRVGAIATFAGVVRAESHERAGQLEALEYTAHESMALGQMQALCETARRQHALHAVRLVHRLGRLNIGEASVAVVVSAPHRAAAFDACRWLIESLKQDVPIFKREIWRDGAATWVDPL